MIRLSKLECACAYTFFVLLTITACTSSTHSGDGGEAGESFISISNPVNGSRLKGKVQVTINGKAENGFSELRIFVGEEQVTSIANPTLPHEQAIKTYHFDNGDYEIRAEAEVAGKGTTLKKSISATFENYMVEIEMDGYVKYYTTTYDKTMLYISDPSGTILGSADLLDRTGDLIQLLPPQEVNGIDDPTYVNITLARTHRSGDFKMTLLNTDAGLGPWNIHLGGESMISSGGESSEKEIYVKVQNFSQDMDLLGFHTDGSFGGSYSYGENVLNGHIEIKDDTNNLMALLERNSSTATSTVVYNWNKNIRNVVNGDTLRYDAEHDFENMMVYSVPHASGLELKRYSYSMSVEPDSWDEGKIYGFFFTGAEYDKNTSDTELGMLVIDENHLHSTAIQMQSQSDANSMYVQSTTGNLPTEFRMINGNVNLVSLSGRDLQIEVEGQADYVQVRSSHSEGNGHQSWAVQLPDTMESFSYPAIEDIVDYELLDVSYINFYDHEHLDGYSEYLNTRWGAKEVKPGTYRYLRKYYTTQKHTKRRNEWSKQIEPPLFFERE